MTVLFVTVSTSLVVQVLQEAVVFVVGGELERVLVVSEEGIVPIGQVGEGTSLKNKIFY